MSYYTNTFELHENRFKKNEDAPDRELQVRMRQGDMVAATMRMGRIRKGNTEADKEVKEVVDNAFYNLINENLDLSKKICQAI